MIERSELLAQVANRYHENDMIQAASDVGLGISRSTISRLLRKARETGVVEITAHYPCRPTSALSTR